MPLRSLLPFAKLAQGGGDFSAGEGSRSLALPGLPVASALICYEVIFPGDVVAGSGAYQIHLALKNKAGGGIDPHAGHNH